ncbi:Uncharacterized protein APZ42_026616 [Daphnia magna]|uniref:Uncharacterized protein n=1 Tax=Daphnia magna TaxID=35525 RepID=A0A164S3Z7_9CRUS|nr:Uncharacterized protein APZ42_026616 [Daphnia magna]
MLSPCAHEYSEAMFSPSVDIPATFFHTLKCLRHLLWQKKRVISLA